MNSLRLLDHLLAPPPPQPAPPPLRLRAAGRPPAWPAPSPSTPSDSASFWRRRRRFVRPPEASRFRRRWARLWGFDWPARPAGQSEPAACTAASAPSAPPHAAPTPAPTSISARTSCSRPAPRSSPAVAAKPALHPPASLAPPCPPRPPTPEAAFETLQDVEPPLLPARAQDDNETLVSTRSSGSDQLSLCETLVASDLAPQKTCDDESAANEPVSEPVPFVPSLPPQDKHAVCISAASPLPIKPDSDATVAVVAPKVAGVANTTGAVIVTRPSSASALQLQVQPLLEQSLVRLVRILIAIVQALLRFFRSLATGTAPDAHGQGENHTAQEHTGSPEEKTSTSQSSGVSAHSKPASRPLSDPHESDSTLPMRDRRPSPPENVRRAQVKAQVVDSTPKTLVLDLDETLIHSVARSSSREGVRSSFGLGSALGVPRRMFGSGLATLGLGPSQATGFPSFGGGTTSVEVVLGGRSVVYTVHKRPGVDAFLAQVAEWYSVVVFTASVREYADPVIDWLDAGRGLFQNRLFRESCIYKNGAYIKDLAAVVRQAAGASASGTGTEEDPLRRVCLLDNSPASWRLHPANGIPIEGWTHDPHDTALMDLLPVLDSLRFCDDVRHVLGIRLLAAEPQPQPASRPASTASTRRAEAEKPVAQAHSTAIKAR